VTKTAYITAAGRFLPGEPVPSEAMERYIGALAERPSATGKRVLSYNGIRTRHYALDTEGKPSHSNADMAARALQDALARRGAAPSDLDLLATATTQGDFLVPGHASMVHGMLGGAGALEVANLQSVCASSLMALKTAQLQVVADDKRLAGVTGSEFSSRFFRPGFYDPAFRDERGRLRLPFEAEFLRWTLSDGAGAVLVEDRPRSGGASLRIDWIDLTSMAHATPVCMFAGAAFEDRDDLAKAWSHHASTEAAAQAGALVLMQDFSRLKLLLEAWCRRYGELVEAGKIVPARIDHFLCHYSAESLRAEIVKIMTQSAGLSRGMIEEERWYSTLTSRGNVGTASIFLTLSDFLDTDKATPGDRVLLCVPESGRGLVGFAHLTVV